MQRNTQCGFGCVLLNNIRYHRNFSSFNFFCLTLLLIILFGQQADTASLINDSSVLFTNTKMANESEVSFRLPKGIKPLNYDLYLHPDLEKRNFEGKVSILIKVEDKQKFIMIHQKDLEINSIEVHMRDENEKYKLEISKVYPVDKFEAFIIEPKVELNAGLYDVNIKFSGSLQNKIVGFYSSRYKDEQNKTRTIATSKFEPTYARHSFPCFDEPGFKAEFDIKMVHPTGDGYNALSNMNIESTIADDPKPGLTTVKFAKSVPMSTYLVCYIVSDFVAVKKDANGLNGKTFPVSVYTTKAKKEQGSFAIDVGVKIIEYYIKLFNIDYPLPKLDMAAIPDFVSGAMENWGLVTYRESNLLYDEESTSTANKERIISVIAHEFAHMWFGNLVTMKWWNDLWLNEGFAEYMQYKSADAILPDWGLLDNFLLDELHQAFDVDAKLSSHPIVQTVSNPDEITAIFDVITYEKGSSILRMLENFVGPDAFYGGVTKYLNQFVYQNAETNDLFKILQENVGTKINVTAIMDTWTRQMGFPVINVVKNKFTYTLTQKRFVANSKDKYDPSESMFKYRWTIPVTYITNLNSTPNLVWFDKDAENLVIKLDEPVEWIKFNTDQVGYYRVNYNQTEWNSLTEVLRRSHESFSSQDRTHLLEDAFALANAGEIGYNVPLNLTLYLSREKHFAPWSVAQNKIKVIDNLLSSTDISDKFREYVRELVDSTYHDVTWNVTKGEEHRIANLRTAVLGLACSVDHTDCMNEAGKIFKNWINDKNDKRPHPDIRGFVYYHGMNHDGEEAEWNTMFERFNKEDNAAEKNKLMNGLAGVRSEFLLKKYINLAMDENYVRSQDALICLRNIASNPNGTQLVWDWVRENWTLLVERYTLNDRYLGQLIPGITKNFATNDKLTEIETFFKKYPEAGAGTIYRAQALETVKTNIQWLENNVSKLDKWLSSRPISKQMN